MKKISISEIQSIYDGIKSQIIYMSFIEGSGLGGSGDIVWIAEDGREWWLMLEGYDIPDLAVCALFPEMNTCLKEFWRIFDWKHKNDFQRVGGWFGRCNELGLTIFIREDFFNRYKLKFDKIDNRISVYDEMKTIEKILNTEESIFIYPNTN